MHIEDRISALSPKQRKLLSEKLCDIRSGQQGRIHAFVRLSEGVDGPNPALPDYLAERLPRYMLPSSTQYLEQFPQLPNGKVDRQALLALAQSQSQSQHQTEAHDLIEDLVPEDSTLLTTLRTIWEDVLQTDEIHPQDDFFELGGDSILSISVVSRAKSHDIALKPGDLFDFPTLAQLCAYLENEQNDQDSKNEELDDQQALRSKNSDGQRIPFFMVHGGSRLLTQLRANLPQDQPIHLLPAHWETADIDPDVTIKQLAAEALQLLKNQQDTGPYAIGGYSVGCIIALEMAQELRTAGEEVKTLFLLDPPDNPKWFKQVPPGMPAHAAHQSIDTQRHLQHMRSLSATQKLAYAAKKLSGHVGAVTSHMLLEAKHAYALACRRSGREIPAAIRKLYVNRTYLKACSSYRIDAYTDSLLVYRSTEYAFDEDCRLWRVITPDADIQTFECEHLQLQRDPKFVADWTTKFARHLQTIQQDN